MSLSDSEIYGTILIIHVQFLDQPFLTRHGWGTAQEMLGKSLRRRPRAASELSDATFGILFFTPGESVWFCWIQKRKHCKNNCRGLHSFGRNIERRRKDQYRSCKGKIDRRLHCDISCVVGRPWQRRKQQTTSLPAPSIMGRAPVFERPRHYEEVDQEDAVG